MKELIVISGKGGTGKTSVTAAFAFLADEKVLCDADVDAADLHLLTAPEVQRREDFQSGNTAVIDPSRCTECGLCREMCRWDAISDEFVVDGIECEGCGVCVDFCPENAVDFPVNTCGEWFVSDTRFGPMVHARLGIAEENSGKLVTLVRQEAKKLAERKRLPLIITDGPPGVGCPVIAAIGGASAVLIVTEPTVSGGHDMERVVQLADHFGVPAMVCVNKFDLNVEKTRDIERYAVEKGATCVGRIPFDPIFTKAMVHAKTVFEYDGDSTICRAIEAVWNSVSEHLTSGFRKNETIVDSGDGK
jgi:MinD superfamily P-loop ATPase